MKTVEIVNANDALNVVLSDEKNKLKAQTMFKLIKFQRDNAPTIEAFLATYKELRKKHEGDDEAFNAEVEPLLNEECDVKPVITMDEIADIEVNAQTMVRLMPIIKD